MKAPCPTLEEALKQAYIDEDKRSGAKMADYYKELTEHTGQNMSTITDVEFLYNTLEIEEQHGLQLPAWTQNFYNNEMREIAARSLALFTDGPIQKRLRGGTTDISTKAAKSLQTRFVNCIARFCTMNCIDISRSTAERDLTPHGRD